MWGSSSKVANNETVISAKTEVSGDVRVSGGLNVDGRIKGNILADPDSGSVVRISEKGMVEGEIRAPRIVINGEVKGDVYSSDHLELDKKAVINGNVHYVMMEMVMGAKVNGKLLYVAAEKGKKAKLDKPELQETKSEADAKSDTTVEAKPSP